MGIFAVLNYEREVTDMNISLNVTNFDEGDVEVEDIHESTAITTVFGACMGMAISYATLLFTIDKKYLHTFLSRKTSNK